MKTGELIELSNIDIEVESSNDKAYITLTNNNPEKNPMTNTEFVLALMQAARDLATQRVNVNIDNLWYHSKLITNIRDTKKFPDEVIRIH